MKLELFQKQSNSNESETLYSLIVNSSLSGIFIIDDNWKFEFANPKLCKILGRRKDEIIGHDFREFLSMESIALVSDRYKKRQKGEKVPVNYEFSVIRKNGEKRFIGISSNIIIDEKGKTKTLSQIQDITDKFRAQETLKKSEEKFRSQFEYSKDMIIIHDLSGKILDVNKSALKTFGYNKKTFLSLKLSDLHPKKELTRSKKSVKNIKEKKHEYFEILFLTKRGKEFLGEVNSNVINFHGTNIVQGIIRDITKFRQNEKELTQFKNELQKKIQEKTAELSEKLSELEIFYEATIDRELRMEELTKENVLLKRKIAELKGEKKKS